MPRLLPNFNNEDEYDKSQRLEQTYSAAIEEIGRRHHLPANAQLRKYAGGYMVVFAYGKDFAVKLYPPFVPHHFKNEVAFYRYLQGKLQLQTPAVVAVGLLDGWDYLVMEQLRDPLLDEAWPRLMADERHTLLCELGEFTAELHALNAEPLLHTCPNWGAFVRQQAKNAVAQQLEVGTTSYWTEQVDAYLKKWLPRLSDDFKPALLHTELSGSCLTAACSASRMHWLYLSPARK